MVAGLSLLGVVRVPREAQVEFADYLEQLIWIKVCSKLEHTVHALLLHVASNLIIVRQRDQDF